MNVWFDSVHQMLLINLHFLACILSKLRINVAMWYYKLILGNGLNCCSKNTQLNNIFILPEYTDPLLSKSWTEMIPSKKASMEIPTIQLHLRKQIDLAFKKKNRLSSCLYLLGTWVQKTTYIRDKNVNSVTGNCLFVES